MDQQLPLSRIETAFERATRRAGGSDVDCPAFEQAFKSELDRAAADEALDELHARGVAEVIRVDRDGERVWGLTPAPA